VAAAAVAVLHKERLVDLRLMEAALEELELGMEPLEPQIMGVAAAAAATLLATWVQMVDQELLL
jgi:hypothetical protein